MRVSLRLYVSTLMNVCLKYWHAGLQIDASQADFYLTSASGNIKEAIRLQSALPPSDDELAIEGN